MKYCLNCKRLNAGKPLYCQYCGRTFEDRICGKCHHINDKSALVCRNCGSSELSEIAGQAPFWTILLKIFFWLFVILLVVGFFRNLALFAPLLIIIGLLLFGYSLLPEMVKKIMNLIFNLLKERIWGKEKKS